MKRRAFTLIELLTAMIIIIILGSVATLNINAFRQTPKREAEKIMSKFHRLTQEADRKHKNFAIKFTDINWYYTSFEIYDNSLASRYFRENFEISSGIKILSNMNNITYGASNNTFDKNFTLTVANNNETDKYYVIFYEGRVRISSDTNPLNDDD